MRGRGPPGTRRGGGGNEMPEDLGLHRICCRRVFGMPLDAEIPPCMIL